MAVSPAEQTLIETTVQLARTHRSPSGTILPADELADTGDRALIEALPQLDTTGRELELGKTLGEGGMGIVRLAEQGAIGRQVAVKGLRKDRDDPRLALALLREAWVTGALEHPNVVPVYSVGVDATGRPLIVMKRIAGTPWSELLGDETHELRDHLRIFTQVCNAVEFASSRGIIHRDLKPDNVMIGEFGEVYVLDWGLAVAVDDDRGGRVQLAGDVEGVCGTPGYMAPEMVHETGAQLSLRTDVYLLGAILHELITGERLHLGDSLEQVLVAALVSAPKDYGADVPVELANIANRAACREPAQRFESAGALRSAIEAFVAHESSYQLVAEAEARLVEWDELRNADERADALTVQRLWGEARFAFLQALSSWPENQRAQRGLLGTLERKFDDAVERDDFESATLMLDEIGERRPDLDERLDVLRARIGKRRAELDQLRALQDSRNLDIGRRTRAFLMLLTAVAFAAVPILAVVLETQGWEIGYGYFYVMSVLKLVDAAGLIYWARESLGKTQVNRQLTASLVLLLLLELGVRPFAQRLGHPVEHSLLVDFGLYATVTANLAITVDRRIYPSALFYVAGAGLSYFAIEHVYWFLAAAHFGSGVCTAITWRPDFIRGPDIRPEPTRIESL